MTAVIRVPISPSPNYLNRMVLLRESARTVGGDVADSDIEAFVSPDRAPPPASWIDHLTSLGINWTDVDPDAFEQIGYGAATLRRMQDPTDCDVIVLADADLFFVGRLDETIETCRRELAVLGVTAYRTPFSEMSFPARATLGRRECWIELFARIGLPGPDFSATHAAAFEQSWDDDVSRCPIYFNFGMVFVPSSLSSGLADSFTAELTRVRHEFDGLLVAQVAFSCALARSGIAARELPVRYNFPNQPPYLPHYPDDVEDMRVLHYMSRDRFDKERDLDSVESIERWLSDVPADELHRRLADLLTNSLSSLRSCPWNQQ